MNLYAHHRAALDSSSGGMALVLALGVLLALTALSTALLTSFHASYRQAQNRERQARCLNIAEAGIEKALVEYRINSAWYTGEEDTPFGSGSFSVAITGIGPERFTVQSTGTLIHGPAVQSRIVVEARIDPGGRVRVLRWEESHQ